MRWITDRPHPRDQEARGRRPPSRVGDPSPRPDCGDDTREMVAGLWDRRNQGDAPAQLLRRQGGLDSSDCAAQL